MAILFYKCEIIARAHTQLYTSVKSHTVMQILPWKIQPPMTVAFGPGLLVSKWHWVWTRRRANPDADGGDGQTGVPQQDHLDLPEPPPADHQDWHRACLSFWQSLSGGGGHCAAQGHDAGYHAWDRGESATEAGESEGGGTSLCSCGLGDRPPARGGTQSQLTVTVAFGAYCNYSFSFIPTTLMSRTLGLHCIVQGAHGVWKNGSGGGGIICHF